MIELLLSHRLIGVVDEILFASLIEGFFPMLDLGTELLVDAEALKTNYLLILKQSMDIKRRINTNALPLEYKYYYLVAIQLEEIADHLNYMIKYLDSRCPKEVLVLLKKTHNLYNGAYEHFHSENQDWFLNVNRFESVWKWYETEKYPLQVYHLRAISERIKNVAKYSFGIN